MITRKCCRVERGDPAPPRRAGTGGLHHRSRDGHGGVSRDDAAQTASGRELVALHADELDDDIVSETIGCFLKDEADVRQLTSHVASRGVGSFIAEGAGAA